MDCLPVCLLFPPVLMFCSSDALFNREENDPDVCCVTAYLSDMTKFFVSVSFCSHVTIDVMLLSWFMGGNHDNRSMWLIIQM